MNENNKQAIRHTLASIEGKLQYGEMYKESILDDLKMIDKLLDYNETGEC